METQAISLIVVTFSTLRLSSVFLWTLSYIFPPSRLRFSLRI